MTTKSSGQFEIVRTRDAHVHRLVQLADTSDLECLGDRDGQADGFLVSDFTEKDYRMFLQRAEHFFVVLHGSDVVGFVLAYSSEAIDPDWAVDSHIRSCYPEPFVVIKQICIHPDFRRQRLAAQLYEHVAEQACDCPLFAALVLQPLNAASVRFHEKLGFRKVFEITPPDGRRRSVWRRNAVHDAGRSNADA